ncbi:MAG: type I phosphomannose isomerase catalytic subunit [Bryobacteraceae bacterium]
MFEKQPEVKQPFELLPIFRERIWGRTSLAPYFNSSPDKEPIGEVWFTFKDNPTSLGKPLGEVLAAYPEVLGSAVHDNFPGVCPLLVKLIFTTDRLSVQVHPDDEYAREHHDSLGKTEAWYVMDAPPSGEVAIGFKEPITPGRFQESIHSGEIEELLEWRKVQKGDIVFTPAGTVHAIGAGLTVCEIQENSDITYRLYDYGRPRELHLEHGMKVSRLEPHDCAPESVAIAPWRDSLLHCDYFRIERLRPQAPINITPSADFYLVLICLKGEGTLAGSSFAAGRAWFVPAGSASFSIDGSGSEWILSYTAEHILPGVAISTPKEETAALI